MAKVVNGVVIDDDLFREYHNFQNGKKCDSKKIKKLLHYYKKYIVSNIKQYEDNGVELPANLKIQMARFGLKNQSLEDLAEKCSLYKIILSSTKDTFPYINIMDDNQRLENNYSASFDMAEPRKLAIKHLTSICLHAEKIVLYDKYFSSKERNVDLLKRILPQKKLKIEYSYIKEEHIESMKHYCAQWEFIRISEKPKRHDRYLIVDDKLEIILTSGFDHLNDDSGDFTYIVRSVKTSRF